MAYDEGMSERIRDCLADVDGVTERKMFGGLAFMVFGNMACGQHNEDLMVRVGPDAYEEALALPGASKMEFTGKGMRGFVDVEAEAVAGDKALCEWVMRGVEYARSLPPK